MGGGGYWECENDNVKDDENANNLCDPYVRHWVIDLYLPPPFSIHGNEV